ncbi:MAG: CPBP family intramembrane metalloprotease [Lachnospiraceae bacterium]|nr:CPBP family intramembrane metalloprotease [Lachnospiraceae bacterium]
MNKKKIKAIVYCIRVAFLVMVIQAVTAFAALAPEIIRLVKEFGFGTEEYSKAYLDYVTGTPVMMYVQFAATAISLVVVAVWYYFGYVRKEKKISGNKTFKDTFKGFPDAAFLFFGGVATWGMAGVLDRLVTALAPARAEEVNEMLSVVLGSGVEVAGVITGILLAPLMEELLMRGIILRRSKRDFGMWGCIIISAILFGVLHMNILQGIYVIPMGLFWGYVGYRYNSVIPCIFLHILNNFIGILIPSKFPPMAVFIIFGCIAAFIGAKYDILKNESPIKIDIEGGYTNVKEK